jgi:hypothetical protein
LDANVVDSSISSHIHLHRWQYENKTNCLFGYYRPNTPLQN